MKESATPGDLFSGPVNIKWEEGAPAPLGRAGHTAVWLNGLMYVGGSFNTTIDSYNPVSNSWNSSVNTPYFYFAMTTLNNKLLIAGGRDESDDKITNQILTLDSGQLMNYTKMTTARSSATAAGHQGMLIITGGKDDENKTLSSTEIFDSTNGKWYTSSNLPEPHYSLRSVIVDNILYLLGGTNKSITHSPAVFTASLDNLSRLQLTWNAHLETPWLCSTSVSVNDTHLLTIGGNKGSTCTSDVYKLNNVSHSWDLIGHIPSARRLPAAVSIADNKVIVIGGQNDKREYTNTVWIGSCEPQ